MRVARIGIGLALAWLGATWNTSCSRTEGANPGQAGEEGATMVNVLEKVGAIG